MLGYSINKDGNYVITETIHSWNDTKISKVEYKRDLSEKRCENEPWRPVDKPTLEWFEKHYRKHFDKLS